ALLRPDQRDDLRVRVELHPEPPRVPVGHRRPELPGAVIRGVAMGRRISNGLAHRLDDVPRRGSVRVSDAERDDVHALGALGRELLVELREQVGRQLPDPPGDPHATPLDRSHASSSDASKTRSAGPVSTTSSGVRSTSRTPPGNRTFALAGTSPASFAATSAAHAPVPQAIVSPTPRSHTRTVSPPSSTATNSTLVRSGNSSWRSIDGPIAGTSIPAGSSCTSRTRCGLPIETAVAWNVRPPASNGSRTKRPSGGPVMGIRARANAGGPIPTVTARTFGPSRCSLRCFTPARVPTSSSVRSVRPSSYTSF